MHPWGRIRGENLRKIQNYLIDVHVYLTFFIPIDFFHKDTQNQIRMAMVYSEGPWSLAIISRKYCDMNSNIIDRPRTYSILGHRGEERGGGGLKCILLAKSSP